MCEPLDSQADANGCLIVLDDSQCTPLVCSVNGCVLPGTCGDEEIEGAEECDCGLDDCSTSGELTDETCRSLSYPRGGSLDCFPVGSGEDECMFNVSACSRLPLYNNFTIDTTNFDLAADITNVTNATLGTNNGMIFFRNQALNFERLDLDRFVTIEDKRIGIDLSGTDQDGIRMNRLDVNSVLIFNNIVFTTPLIKKDGADCTDCVIESYDTTNNILTVAVSGFSIYTVEETFTIQETPTGGPPSGPGGGGRTPQCRDGNDNDRDGKRDYPNDPGCLSSNDNSEEDIIECKPRWLCDDWSECINGIKTRECYDSNNCNVNTSKPNLGQECINIIEEIKKEVVYVAEGKKLGRRTIILLILIGIIIIEVLTVEILWRRKRLNYIKERHSHIYKSIKLARDNIDNERLAGLYYNKAREIFERHENKCDKKAKEFVKRELMDIYKELNKRYKR